MSVCIQSSFAYVVVAYKIIIFSILAQPCQWGLVVGIAGAAGREDGKRSWDKKNQKMLKGIATVKKVRTLRGRASAGLRKEANMSLGTYSYKSWASKDSFETYMMQKTGREDRKRVCEAELDRKRTRKKRRRLTVLEEREDYHYCPTPSAHPTYSFNSDSCRRYTSLGVRPTPSRRVITIR